MRLLTLPSSADINFNRLRNQVHVADDPFQAAAIYPWLLVNERLKLEPAIFRHSRYPRMFAQAPYVSIALLDRLANEDDVLILNKLAKNPLTPIKVLKRLIHHCDHLVRIVSIARHPQASAELLDSLDISLAPSLQTALCFNPNTGLSQLNRLLAVASPVECKAMAKNPNANGDFLGKLWRQCEDLYLWAEIVAHPNCPRYLLDQAIASADVLLRRKAASNISLGKIERIGLLSDTDASVRVAALRHLGSGSLHLVAETASRVKRELARKAGLDETLMQRLAEDSDKWVRCWIARNPATPISLLEILAADIQPEVRRGVARNPLAPDDICHRLANDPVSWVRAGISIRHDLAADIIEWLSNDDSIDVLSGLGRNPKSPAPLLNRIALHDHRDVRRTVILNLQSPLTVLRHLLEDPYALNRAMLCSHPNMGADELWQLLDDPEPQVRFCAVQAMAIAASGTPVIA